MQEDNGAEAFGGILTWKYIGILQNRFRFVDIFLILYSKYSIWDAIHDQVISDKT